MYNRRLLKRTVVLPKPSNVRGSVPFKLVTQLLPLPNATMSFRKLAKETFIIRYTTLLTTAVIFNCKEFPKLTGNWLSKIVYRTTRGSVSQCPVKKRSAKKFPTSVLVSFGLALASSSFFSVMLVLFGISNALSRTRGVVPRKKPMSRVFGSQNSSNRSSADTQFHHFQRAGCC